MPHPHTPSSMAKTLVTNENRPAWCSPGYSRSTVIRNSKAKPLTEAKPGNQVSPESKPQLPGAKVGKALVTRDTAQADPYTAGSVAVETKVRRVASPLITGQRTPRASSTGRPKPTSATKAASPITEETPPRSRQLKRAPTVLLTPTNKSRKPVASAVTPKGNFLRGGTPKGTSSRGFTPKGSSPGVDNVRARERSSRTANDSPSAAKKLKERPSGVPSEGTKSGRAREKIQQLSAWPMTVVGSGASGSGRTVRKASPAQGRPPVKHLFLSPQGSKKTNSKRDAIRTSMESHGLWASASNSRSRSSVGKHDINSEMPPPAQPTNSPEIPKRGSRETSGEGIRGYFGAGPMVAPDGLGGFVRDRRKCKPRGTLMVGAEGLSVESDSSGAVESSTQIPLPSVASVEWMQRTVAVSSITDIPSSSASGRLRSDSTTLSEYFKIHDNEDRKSAAVNQEAFDREASGDGHFLQQLRQSRISTQLDNGIMDGSTLNQHKQHGRRSKMAGQQSRSGRSLENKASSDDNPLKILKEGYDIDWREGLPYEVIEMNRPMAGKGILKGEHLQQLTGTSISFKSSWVRPASVDKNSNSSEGPHGIGSIPNWQVADSPWYGFSPITPDLQGNSQLSGCALTAIDALIANGSVRRRIITDRSLSPQKASRSSTESMSLVIGDDLPSCSSSPCAHSSLDASASFQFAALDSTSVRRSLSPPRLLSAGAVAQNGSLDDFVCRDSSPAEQFSYGEDLLCQTASPVEDTYYDSSADRPNIDSLVEDYSLACSVACGLDDSEDACSSGESSIDLGDIVGCADDCRDYSEEDEVEYASPVAGDHLSPRKPSSPSVEFEKTSVDSMKGNNEFGHPVLKGAGGRRSSISRSSISRASINKTLEELMRHNFSL